ncbi:MAG: relaxase/mobilization nuclease domain-containing protein [Bacilli bacterium]|nr:relaxase/mobilization nuclease domain-containing protein [Bacilli bacterium]
MATTSIWSIKNNLKVSLDYIMNPEKTINNDYGNSYYNGLELSSNKDYDFKNELSHYVSGVNCLAHRPYEDMMFTKKQYDKTDGIIAFHAYQSFKEREVTPDIAHEIGVKLAEEMWDDYEVVVATHQNTNHIHNHFIINSVSYKTGKKYNNNKSAYARLRHISDALCQEYGLSTLEEDTKYKNSYKNKWQDNNYYRIAKEDIDTIISESISSKQFLTKLKQLGYKYYIKYDKLTIYKEEQDKIRVEKIFGKEYSLDRLNERLTKSIYVPYKPLSQRTIYQQYLLKTKPKYKGIYELYLYYCYLLKVFPQEHPKQNLPYSIRKDIKIMNQISEETRFMVSNKIETLEDLKVFRKENSIKLAELVSKRENLWKKYKRVKTEDDKNKIYKQIEELQPIIKELYKNNKYCDGIEKRSIDIQDNIDNFDKDIGISNEKDNIRI